MGNSPTKGTKKHSFPGSALVDSAAYLCGSMKDVSSDDDLEPSLLQKADAMCISSPKQERQPQQEQESMNPTSALFARALVSEVTDNPRTMKPKEMAEREKRLLKAQEAARKTTKGTSKPVGTMGQPNVLGSLAHALKGDDISVKSKEQAPSTSHFTSTIPPTPMRENRAQVNVSTSQSPATESSQHSVTIGLSLSRRNSSLGHPDTVTRQTAFDFNELQDRQYKYVSSTDSSGWMAGGGERGGNIPVPQDDESFGNNNNNQSSVTSMLTPQGHHKLAAPDTVHIPIITIDAASPAVVNQIVSALARGEVFIPHMTVLPEALSVNGVSPPDLVVRFGCERNDDTPPEEWPNWCLEFMHNQLYDYFQDVGARWQTRPFQITLARKVRWKTVKHMNRYFSHAERVIDAWREKGPQYLDPQLSYIDGGATPEEVARPHGIYLMRNGIPTNYFSPNFDPPYTTKMTRSLLLTVLAKSWDKKRREWTSEPVPRLVTPASLVASMCGCADPGQGGFIASEVTNTNFSQAANNIAVVRGSKVDEMIDSDDDDDNKNLQANNDLQASQSEELLHASQLTSSTKMSSVLLTPYEEEKASSEDDDLNDLDLEEDDDDGDDYPMEPIPVTTPKMSETSIDSTDSWDNPFPSDKNTNALPPPRARGRYGKSPTPEQAATSRLRSPTDGVAMPNSSDHFSHNGGGGPPSESGTSITEFMEREMENEIESETAGGAPSENGTTTTVQHANSTSAKLMERELERKRVREQRKALKLETEGLDKVSESLENITPKVRLCVDHLLTF